MTKMLYKELKLCIHPIAIIFLALSAMVLIPNYPYSVTFFYTTLGIFFICLTGRENNDIFYSMLLPIRKRDIVKSRFLVVICIEIAQVILAGAFIILRNILQLPDNKAGIEANIAFIGLALLFFGIFNLVFFTLYYKNPDKIGKSYAICNIVMWIYMLVEEGSVIVIPFMRDYIDTIDPQYMQIKSIFFVVGILAYCILTFIAYKKSIKSFELLDL